MKQLSSVIITSKAFTYVYRFGAGKTKMFWLLKNQASFLC